MEASDLVKMGIGKFMEKVPNWQEREYMKFFMMNHEASQLSSTHPPPAFTLVPGTLVARQETRSFFFGENWNLHREEREEKKGMKTFSDASDDI